MSPYEKIIHVTPEYPPHIGGVADFACIIKESMDAWNVPQEVVIAGIKPISILNQSNILKSRNFAELSQMIQAIATGSKTLLVFHYVCYGYSLKGVPFLLPRILQHFKANHNVTILTYFHELYATDASPFKSAFWLGFIQKQLAKKIAKLSDIRITTSASYKKELDEWDVNTIDKNIYMPVFSNIPESLNELEWNKKDQVVIFGSKGSRNKVYREKESVHVLLTKTKTFTWFDIGTPVESIAAIKQLGVLSPVDISTVLKEAKIGLIQYHDMPIEKSGVFAAYAANGVVAIVLNCSQEASVYVPGIHYLLYNNMLEFNEEVLEKIRMNAYKKYLEVASVEVHIKKIVQALEYLSIT
jgi:hypothetical protein